MLNQRLTWTPHKVYLYKHAYFDKLREDKLSFSNTFFGIDPLSRTLDDNWTMLKEALLTGIKGNISTMKIKANHRLPWITNNIQVMICKKDCLLRKATRSKSCKDWDIYKLCRVTIQKMTTMLEMSVELVWPKGRTRRNSGPWLRSTSPRTEPNVTPHHRHS